MSKGLFLILTIAVGFALTYDIVNAVYFATWHHDHPGQRMSPNPEDLVGAWCWGPVFLGLIVVGLRFARTKAIHRGAVYLTCALVATGYLTYLFWFSYHTEDPNRVLGFLIGGMSVLAGIIEAVYAFTSQPKPPVDDAHIESPGTWDERK